MTNFSDNTDTTLLTALAKDDEQAFAALYHKYHQKLFYFVLNLTTTIFPGLNHLLQHCTTCTSTEYAQLPETIAPAVIDAITTWLKTI